MSARGSFFLLSVVLFFSGPLIVAAVAQSRTDESDYAAYEQAVDELLSGGRGSSLEIFLEDHPNSRLSKDALQLLIWNYQQSDRLDRAAWAAHMLLRIDPATLPRSP